MDLPRGGGLSNDEDKSFAAECFDRCTEPRLLLLLEWRLFVDRSDGAPEDLLDLRDSLRSGMMTTGIPPFFQTSRRAFRLAIEFIVPEDAILSVREVGGFPVILGRLGFSTWPTEVEAELDGEISELESLRVVCFLTCRSVFCLCGGTSTRMASTTVETVDLDDIPEDRLTSVLTDDSEVDAVQRGLPLLANSRGKCCGDGAA